MKKNNSTEDTYSYSGWLNSDKLMKRAFAVLGHYIVAQLAIGIVIGLVVVILTVLGITISN